MKVTQKFFERLCSQYGEISVSCAFLQGLTPPLHPAPGTTRCDMTLARECQRLGASGCFSAKCSFRPPAFLRNDETNLSPYFATIGVLSFIAIAIHYTPNPSIFYSLKNNFIISPQWEQSVLKKIGGYRGKEKTFFQKSFLLSPCNKSITFLLTAGENTETEGVQADEAGCVFVVIGIAVFK